MTEALIGVDLGTTAVKCSLLTSAGDVLGSATREYELRTPDPKIVEVDAPTYWDAFTTTVRQTLSGAPACEVRALSFSVQGETLLLCDSTGESLAPAIVWLDNRAEAEAAELAAHFDPHLTHRVTGQPQMVATWPAAKILWVRRHDPDLFARTARYLLLEDWIIQRLTGSAVAEPSLLCSTCYWDIAGETWWPEMLDALGITVGQLPEPVQSGQLVGKLRAEVADELGLPHTVVVVAGGLDQACGALGVGNSQPGMISENTGAALAICSPVEEPLIDPAGQMPCHCHALPHTYMLHTFTSGGIGLRWFRDLFRAAGRPDLEYRDLEAEAAAVAPGSDGLLTLPHLQGALAPDGNPFARGVYFGFTLAHQRGHFTRSFLESVCFAVRRNLEVLDRLGVGADQIRSLGGGARSPLWKQIEADVTRRPVVVPEDPEAATRGAAMLAGVGAGVFADVSEAVSAMVRPGRTFSPNPHLAAVYDDAYGRYVELYDQLEPCFRRYAS